MKIELKMSSKELAQAFMEMNSWGQSQVLLEIARDYWNNTKCFEDQVELIKKHLNKSMSHDQRNIVKAMMIDTVDRLRNEETD